MTPLDVMRCALEALEEANPNLSPNGRADRLVNESITTLASAIAELESAEPVGRYIGQDGEYGYDIIKLDYDIKEGTDLYTAPPPPKQKSVEPVAWLLPDGCIRQEQEYKYDENAIPLYTALPAPSVPVEEVWETVEKLRQHALPDPHDEREAQGWQLVPKEPTNEMTTEAALSCYIGIGLSTPVYKAMLSAAPSPKTIREQK